MTTFRKLALEVLKLRDEQGIRGAAREVSRYRTHIETAAFIDQPIADIRPRDIRAWLRWMAQRDAQVRKNESPRKLDRSTISRAQSLVSAVFAEAVERELVETNPCLGVKQKKVVDESDTEDEFAFLTAEEQERLTSCASISKANRLLIRFAIGTGLRAGEQCNLELADLHIEGADPHLIVRYSNPHKGRKVPPKSGKKRRVPLLPYALAAAKEWLAYLPTFAPSNPLELVFPTANGKRRPEGKICGRQGTIKPWLRAAGIELRPHLVWHSLRHTCATNLVTGVWGRIWTPHEVQPLLGHSSVQITERYAHFHHEALSNAARETAAVAPTLVPKECMPEAFDTVRDLALFDDERTADSEGHGHRMTQPVGIKQ